MQLVTQQADGLPLALPLLLVASPLGRPWSRLIAVSPSFNPGVLAVAVQAEEAAPACGSGSPYDGNLGLRVGAIFLILVRPLSPPRRPRSLELTLPTRSHRSRAAAAPSSRCAGLPLGLSARRQS